MDLKRFRKEMNVRDLGGYKSADGRVVKKGCFYRSAELFMFNEEEIEEIRNSDIKVILDLRSRSEYEAKPDPIFEHIRLEVCSGNVSHGAEGIDFSRDGMRKMGKDASEQLAMIKQYYQHIPFKNESYHKLFTIIQKRETPVLFHCASGKDRTGVAAMLVLFLLGVPEETVMEDYLLSNVYLRDWIAEEFAKSTIDLEQHPETKELLQMLSGVSENIGRYLLQQIYNRFSTMEEYFEQEYGLDAKTIQKIRDAYLEEG